MKKQRVVLKDSVYPLREPILSAYGAAPSIPVCLLCASIFGFGLWSAPYVAAWINGEQPPIEASTRAGCR